jgi:hypothetical protein
MLYNSNAGMSTVTVFSAPARCGGDIDLADPGVRGELADRSAGRPADAQAPRSGPAVWSSGKTTTSDSPPGRMCPSATTPQNARFPALSCEIGGAWHWWRTIPKPQSRSAAVVDVAAGAVDCHLPARELGSGQHCARAATMVGSTGMKGSGSRTVSNALCSNRADTPDYTSLHVRARDSSALPCARPRTTLATGRATGHLGRDAIAAAALRQAR